MRFVHRVPVDRHGLRPRDDKDDGFLFNLQSSPVHLHSSKFTLHSSFPGSQWIATGISQCPRDDKSERECEAMAVIARRERSERRGNPSCLECTWDAVRLSRASGSPRGTLAMTNKLLIYHPQRRLSKSLPYSSPPRVHSYFEVSRSRIFQDNAGPRRVSSFDFRGKSNPLNQLGSQHGSQGCCCGCSGCCCCAWRNASSSRRCSGTTAFDPVRARCPRLAPKTHILALHTLNFSLQADSDWTDCRTPVDTDVFAAVPIHQ